MQLQRISVVGLGKLGAVLAAVMADKGLDVTGVDLNPAAVDAINRGLAPVDETGLDELMIHAKSRLRATTNLAEAVAESQATFIIVPTPSGPDGRFSLDATLVACRGIGAALRHKSGYHLVVLCSTVMPGSTGGAVRECLEQASGKQCGEDFGLCYNPEFIALGSVIRDMLRPDVILIGESDERAGEMLAQVYLRTCENQPSVQRMNFVNAEITKISVNTYVTTKISYANMLAEVCEQLPGADVDVVTAAVGRDSRIGTKYLRGALGYGGPCFPRDNVAFGALARGLGVDPALAESTDRVNRRQVSRLSEMVLRMAPQADTVGILGLSYKPETGVVEESQGVGLARDLLARGICVRVYDPAAMPAARAILGDAVTYAESPAICIGGCDAVVITTPWAEFNTLIPQDFGSGRNEQAKPVLVDCWRMLKDRGFEATTKYVLVGSGKTESARSAVPA
jgi:UDPglucose 6-dehydrogenase